VGGILLLAELDDATIVLQIWRSKPLPLLCGEIARVSVPGKYPATMRRLGTSLFLIALSLPLFSAREQQVFSLDHRQAQTITPPHHQPWSLLLTQDTATSDCVIIHLPELAQKHRLIKDQGDVLIINKTLSRVDGIECLKEHTLEIIGFDKRIVWTKTNELCSSIDYQYLGNDEPLAEYEVVCSLRLLS
jgi:hypothetical protein